MNEKLDTRFLSNGPFCTISPDEWRDKRKIVRKNMFWGVDIFEAVEKSQKQKT